MLKLIAGRVREPGTGLVEGPLSGLGVVYIDVEISEPSSSWKLGRGGGCCGIHHRQDVRPATPSRDAGGANNGIFRIEFAFGGFTYLHWAFTPINIRELRTPS